MAKHKNAYILKTMLDRADCADFGCHNSIRLETEHFLNTLALTFISFSGRFVFAMQKHYLFFVSDPLVWIALKVLEVTGPFYLLLTSFKKDHPDITLATLSSWHKQTILWCYIFVQVKAHDIRAFAASKAFYGGASVE